MMSFRRAKGQCWSVIRSQTNASPIHDNNLLIVYVWFANRVLPHRQVLADCPLPVQSSCWMNPLHNNITTYGNCMRLMSFILPKKPSLLNARYAFVPFHMFQSSDLKWLFHVYVTHVNRCCHKIGIPQEITPWENWVEF